MAARTIQLVLHYDGDDFAGWQRQPRQRTVQGVVEDTLARLCDTPVTALGAGRTDAGVHARGQAVGVRVPERWSPAELRRALNALLPADVWVARAHAMHDDFHARYSATSRRYSYYIGLDDTALSPFRRRWEWHVQRSLRPELLVAASRALVGTHCFRAFAARGTAGADDDHRCSVHHAAWRDRDGVAGLVFEIEANRFLHHMVRFLVGTLLDIASGRRDEGTIEQLLGADDNSEVSPPAPAHGLFLDRVDYPAALYLVTA